MSPSTNREINFTTILVDENIFNNYVMELPLLVMYEDNI